jgi:hypothetical protein
VVDRLTEHYITEHFSNPITHHRHSYVLDGLGHPRIIYGYGRLYYAYNNGGGWQIETADDSGGQVESASLALDDSGNPAASYCRGDGKLTIARRTGGVWNLGQVDTACVSTSIAKISSGLMVIAYSTGSQLWYAVPGLVGGHSTWIRSLFTSADPGYDISGVNLIIDGTGALHIGYYQLAYKGDQFMYLHSNASGWDAPMIIAKGIYSQFNGMGLTADNRATFSYVLIDGSQGGLGVLQYSRQDIGHSEFTALTVKTFSAEESVDYISMGIFSDYFSKMVFYRKTWGSLGNHEYMDYYYYADVDSGTLYTATWSLGSNTSPFFNLAIGPGGYYASVAAMSGDVLNQSDENPWSWQAIDHNQYTFDKTSLALDAQDRAHVSYYDWSNQNLMFAAQDTGSGWSHQTLDANGNVGRFSSLAIAPDGSDNIAYYDATNGDLKLIYYGQGGWLPPITVDGELENKPDVGAYPSLEMDADSLWHISYYDVTDHALKYANFKNGSWTNTIIDHSADVGQYSSLVLDGSGYAHIAYFDATNHKLRYAYKNLGGWHFVDLDRGADGPAGIGVSLAALPHGFAVAYIVQTPDSNVVRYMSCATIAGNCIWTAGVEAGRGQHPGYDDYGSEVSLAIDSSGNPIIAYGSQTLHVVSKTSSGWNDVMPNLEAYTNGGHPSLAIDHGGKPHVSYLSST